MLVDDLLSLFGKIGDLCFNGRSQFGTTGIEFTNLLSNIICWQCPLFFCSNVPGIKKIFSTSIRPEPWHGWKHFDGIDGFVRIFVGKVQFDIIDNLILFIFGIIQFKHPF